MAAHRHLEIMYEASENQGCDRHLFGLSMIAQQNGIPFELTEDPSWIKRYYAFHWFTFHSIGILAVGVATFCYQLVVSDLG